MEGCLLALVLLMVHVKVQGINCRVTMQVVNFSEARSQLKKVLDSVVDDADYTVITRRDAEDAVVMSLDHFNGLMETVHLLSSPANAAHLAESIAQYRSGEATNQRLLDE